MIKNRCGKSARKCGKVRIRPLQPHQYETILLGLKEVSSSSVGAYCKKNITTYLLHTLRTTHNLFYLYPVQSEENRFISYDTSTVPEIQLEDYMWRICDYTYISPTTLLMACIYIDRLIGEGLILSQLNVFKLFFTSVRVASKVHELRSLSNKNFAVVGGVTTEQMNQLESLFMRDFKWKLWVEHETFVQYCQRYALFSGGKKNFSG